ncbi:MAG: hypothetical protein SOW41_03750 [Anaerococcus sp.]|nr:hypothetical protein [Peptoniphilaceae bacterium]MDY3055160.1 hypothetical protein [Anaerococcus sp.]
MVNVSFAKEEQEDFKTIVENTISSQDLSYKVEDYSLSNKETKKINVILAENGYLDKLNDYGYKKVDHAYLNTVKVESNNFDKAYIIPIYYENNNTSLFTQIVYLPEYNSVLSLASVEYNKNSNNLEEFFSYTELSYFRELRYSLPKFVCDMGGAVACTTFCTGVGTAFPVFGVACSLICGPAFGYLCDGVE